jgi:hypothetical protein
VVAVVDCDVVSDEVALDVAVDVCVVFSHVVNIPALKLCTAALSAATDALQRTFSRM